MCVGGIITHSFLEDIIWAKGRPDIIWGKGRLFGQLGRNEKKKCSITFVLSAFKTLLG
jgi:hypothetical protein